MEDKLLHSIDKRLAVLEALNKQHVKDSTIELHEMRKALDGLKIRVASIAGIVSIVVGMGVKWLNVFS